MVAKERERFSQNAPGPFYVANGACITCMVPQEEAPDLIGFDEEASHCYFKKQPSTPEEVERATRAVWASCCEAVQYAGDNPVIIRRIAEHGKEAMEKMMEEEEKPQRWWKFW